MTWPSVRHSLGLRFVMKVALLAVGMSYRRFDSELISSPCPICGPCTESMLTFSYR